MIEPEANRQPQQDYFDELCAVLRQTLQLPDDVALSVDTGLLGAIAEFDSMSVVTVLTELEEQFGFEVDDDEISADTFESVGTLLTYLQAKADE